MDRIDDLMKDIERDLVINLAISTKYKRISFDDSKKIARDFIDIFPLLNYDDLFEKLYLLSDKYREIRKIYVKYAPSYYELKDKYALAKVRMFFEEKIYEKP